MKTEFSPPYRIHQSIAAEWQVINSRGGYECAADSRRHAEELARELNSRRLLATTSEQDLIELGDLFARCHPTGLSLPQPPGCC